MRILFLANELLTLCGVSKHLYYILKDLQENHHEHEYFIMCGGGDATEKFRQLEIPIYINKNFVHKPRSIKRYLLTLFLVNRFVRQNKIELIHSHHHYLASIAEKVGRHRSVKTLMTNHGILQKQGLLNHYSSNNIIVLNESIERFLIKKFDDKKNVFLLPHGFEVPSYQIQKKTKKIQILLGSRLVREKGTDIFLEALTNIDIDDLGVVDIKIAGLGKCLERLKEFVQIHNLPVNFLGKVRDMNELMRNNDIFIFPTRAKYEGLPTVLIEAGLHKNIIISSNFVHYETFLRNNVNSIIFDSEDPIDLAYKLEYAIQHIEKVRNLGERVYDDFKNKFNIKTVNKKLLDIYRKILDN